MQLHSLWLAWLVANLVAPCRGSIRTVRIEGTEDSNGDFTDIGVGVAQISLETDELSPTIAVNPFTHIGCYSVAGNESGVNLTFGFAPEPATVNTPLLCVIRCEALNLQLAGMVGESCFCLPDDTPGDQVADGNCSTPCNDEYYNGTVGVCGGPSHMSLFKPYDFIHQTAAGCYDPFRVLWYQGVAIEEYDNATGMPYFTWYLHASSGSSGEPIFPYHQRLDRMQFGFHYDLDDSRIVSHVMSSGAFGIGDWAEKASADETWAPEVRTLKIDSRFLNNIITTPSVIPFDTSASSAADYVFNIGVSALDSIHNVYYVAVPIVPSLQGVGESLPDATTRLYGILLGDPPDTTGEGTLIVNQELTDKIVVLEANSEYHTLFGLLHSPVGASFAHYYVKFGESTRNNFTNVVEFSWQFTSAQASVVNPFDFGDFTELYYQIGATAVDHLNRKSYIAYKNSPDADQPYYILEIDQNGFTERNTYLPISSPSTQGFFLINSDPLIPLTLPAPVLVSAIFQLDARSITVSFDSATLEGALPVDIDGDTLPDDINEGARLIGRFDCKEVFSRTTADLLGSPPDTECEFTSSSVIRIYLSVNHTIQVGEAISLRDGAIYAFRDGEWSVAASGGLFIRPPDPLLAPTITLPSAVTVDLCSGVTLNAENSFNDGGVQIWKWALTSVTCLLGREPTASVNENFEDILLQATAEGPFTAVGNPSVAFTAVDLEAGCTYNLQVNLTSRWGVTASKNVQLIKQSAPAPQVSILGLDDYETFRSERQDIQTEVELSQCVTAALENRARRYEWTAQVDTISQFTGETVQQTITLSGVDITRSVLTIPRFTLEPDTVYTFSVRVAYEDSWEVEGAFSIASVTVRSTRAPIAAYVRGGTRDIQRNVFALDARVSFDPDYPDLLIGSTTSTDWTFTYTCQTPEGAACFPSDPTTGELNLASCAVESDTNTFMDLNILYPIPTFSSSLLAPTTYYCTHPTENGVLILSVPSDGNYTFTVNLQVLCSDPLATCREAETTASMLVELVGVEAPEIDFVPLQQAKVINTNSLRVSGGIIEEDVAQYGDNVNYSWSFSRQEVVGSGTILVVPPELDTSIDPSSAAYPFLSNPLGSQHLVIKANVLLASSIYNFRLSATTPHPVYPGETVTGYGTLTIATAGAKPSGGTLIVTPTSSDMTETKTFLASQWSAEDTPLTYMFYYKGTATDSPYPLRLAPATEAQQTVRCLKPGEADNDFNVFLELVICTTFGACHTHEQNYQSFLPDDWIAANNEVLALLDVVGEALQNTIMSCMYVPDTTQTGGGRRLTGSPGPYYAYYNGVTTSTNTGTPLTDDQKTQFQGQVDFAVQRLLDLQGSSSSNIDAVTGNMQTVQNLAGSGLPVSDNMLTLSQSLTGELEAQADSGDANTDETETAATASFNALAQMTIASNNAEDESFDVVRRLREIDARIARRIEQKQKAAEAAIAKEARQKRRSIKEVSYEKAKRRRLTSANPCQGVGNFPSFEARQQSCGTISTFEQAEEALELAWLTSYAEIEALARSSSQATVQDEQYISNYTAHLSARERDSVLRRWFAEKARLQLRSDEIRAARVRVTRNMFDEITRIGGVIVKQMAVNEDARVFTFPLGTIKVGKNLDLLLADSSFELPDSRWRLGISSTEAWGWLCISFNADPLTWALGNPISGSPSKIFSLTIFEQDGQEVVVSQQPTPITLMSDQSGLAQSSCSYFDWTGDGGRGGWSHRGVLSNDVGCVSTHLSVIGMFLDVAAPVVELPEALDVILGETDIEWNYAVIICVAMAVVFGVVFHYWGFKQDEIDIYKIQEDDEDDPKNEIQRMTFREQLIQFRDIFLSVTQRDHIAVSVFFRDKKRKVTRLQKASVLFAALSGVSAVAALFYGEHITDSKHYVAVGIISAVIVFPMVRMLRLLFVSNPFGGVLTFPPPSNTAAAQAKEGGAPLVGRPVDDEEDDEDNVSPVHFVAGAGQTAVATADSAAGGSPQQGGGAPLYLPALDPVNAGQGDAGVLAGVPPPPPRGTHAGDVPAPPPRPGSQQADIPSQPAYEGADMDLYGQSDASAPALVAVVPSAPGGPRPPQPLPVLPHTQEDVTPARHLASPRAGQVDSAPATSAPSVAMSDDNLGGPSRAQVQLLRRVRRMYIESVIMSSERMVYDERVDLRSTASHPFIWDVVNYLAHTAVACFWIVAVVVTLVYAVHLSVKNALRWFYACMTGWGFCGVILEFVRIMLVTIIENQQANMRRRVVDRHKLEEEVEAKKRRKRRQMDALLGMDVPAEAPPPPMPPPPPPPVPASGG